MKMRLSPAAFLLLSSILTVLWVMPVKAEDSSVELEKLRRSHDALQKRVDELEKREAEAPEQQDQAARDKEKGVLPITPYYKDGFFLETADEQFRLNVTGVLQTDARVFPGSTESPDSIDIRRARFDFRGWHYKSNVFRLQLEMADTPYLRNAYWTFKKWPQAQLQLGQFKIPVGGADFLTEEAQINFIEYSVDTPISPFFDRGFMLWGLPFDGIVQYCAGVFTGAGLDADQNSGDLDDSKDFAGRLLFVPFKKTDMAAIQGIHIGGGYQYGMESIGTRRGETRNRTEDFNSYWFDWKASSVDLQRRARWGAEAHYLLGPLTLSYEYNAVGWHDITVYDADGTITSELPDTYSASVHQLWASYFLTGEKKEFQDVFFAWRQPKPKKNFSLRNFSLRDGTWGAWEVLARGAYRETDKTLFDRGVLDGSRQGYSLTGGINWIANPKVRIMLNVNYLRSEKGTGILTQSADKGKADGAKEQVDDEIGILLRFVLTI